MSSGAEVSSSPIMAMYTYNVKTGLKGNCLFCFYEKLDVFQDEVKRNIKI